MKKILFLLILTYSLLNINCYAQQYGWYKLDPATIPEAPNFSSVHCVTDDTVWFSIKGPFFLKQIYRTDDGGSSFTAQNTPFTTTAIQMLNKDVGFAVGFSEFVLKTTSGGVGWSVLDTSSSNTLFDISFPKSTNPSNPTGYTGGDMSFYKVDSIVTNLSPPYVGSYKSMSAPSNDNVWICTATKLFFYNNSSYTEYTPHSGTYNDLHFINSQEGWVVGNNALILHTNNGGTNWDVQSNPSFDHLRSVYFLNSNEGWAVGDNGAILHTTNGGADWTMEASGLTSEYLTGVHFTSAINGYVVGENETILKFGEVTSVKKQEETPREFSLLQNYPNPFNPNTKIKFTIPSYVILSEAKNLVTLKVYDVLGNEVATLVKEELSAGEYEVEFSGNELTSGVYFYQLKAGNFIETKKMILLK